MSLSYMRLNGPQTHITEEYVSTPPALLIVDEVGNVWTLGMHVKPGGPRGEFSFDVMLNGQVTGEVASRIERRKGRVRAFTQSGWKYWNGQSFV